MRGLFHDGRARVALLATLHLPPIENGVDVPAVRRDFRKRDFARRFREDMSGEGIPSGHGGGPDSGLALLVGGEVFAYADYMQDFDRKFDRASMRNAAIRVRYGFE